MKRCTHTYLKDDTEAHYPRSIHHLVHDIIQSFLAANGILQEIKTLDHINMHTSLRPRKLSTFIVIVRHDDEHGHHAARHSNVFVYSSPRHNYDKTSENTIRNSGWTCGTRTKECCTRVRLGCAVREGKTPLLVADTGIVSLLHQRHNNFVSPSCSWPPTRLIANRLMCIKLSTIYKNYVLSFFVSYSPFLVRKFLFLSVSFPLVHFCKLYSYIHGLCDMYAVHSLSRL